MNDVARRRRLERYGFAPDPFQVQAFDALDAGESVLVAAPTGSGKTVIAEYGLEMAIEAGKRGFYTAPIKALSNQKYHDLCAYYGNDRVGLLTGDNAINVDAPLLVMTTEVLRNMIYARSAALDDLGVVVLDEVHFLQDEYRGPVWEEVIIHLEPEVRLVALSATVSNADEIADWLTTVRGPTRAVVEGRRPVELHNMYAYGDKANDEIMLVETLVNGAANPKVLRIESGEHDALRRRGGKRGRFRARGVEFTGQLRGPGSARVRDGLRELSHALTCHRCVQRRPDGSALKLSARVKRGAGKRAERPGADFLDPFDAALNHVLDVAFGRSQRAQSLRARNAELGKARSDVADLGRDALQPAPHGLAPALALGRRRFARHGHRVAVEPETFVQCAVEALLRDGLPHLLALADGDGAECSGKRGDVAPDVRAVLVARGQEAFGLRLARDRLLRLPVEFGRGTERHRDRKRRDLAGALHERRLTDDAPSTR
ncbi:MAG: hypothetical protein RL552_881 [Actinomycetota bacterium]